MMVMMMMFMVVLIITMVIMMVMLMTIMMLVVVMMVSQAKYAVSYTTINAFVPARTPRCEVAEQSLSSFNFIFTFLLIITAIFPRGISPHQHDDDADATGAVRRSGRRGK